MNEETTLSAEEPQTAPAETPETATSEPVAESGTEGEMELADNAFDFDVEAEDGDDSAADSNAEEGGETAEADEPFTLDENSGIPQEYAEGLGAIAKEIGVSGGKGAQLIQRAWEYAKAQERAENKRLGLELKKEWGAEFEAKLAATTKFAAQLSRKAGLNNAQMEPLKSPYGVRLLNAMRELVQEGGGFAGGAKEAPKPLTPEQEIDKIYNDPDLFRALTDPGNEQYKAVNARLNKLMGII